MSVQSPPTNLATAEHRSKLRMIHQQHAPWGAFPQIKALYACQLELKVSQGLNASPLCCL